MLTLQFTEGEVFTCHLRFGGQSMETRINEEISRKGEVCQQGFHRRKFDQQDLSRPSLFHADYLIIITHLQKPSCIVQRHKQLQKMAFHSLLCH